jgi:hypothetical protein
MVGFRSSRFIGLCYRFAYDFLPGNKSGAGKPGEEFENRVIGKRTIWKLGNSNSKISQFQNFKMNIC